MLIFLLQTCGKKISLVKATSLMKAARIPPLEKLRSMSMTEQNDHSTTQDGRNVKDHTTILSGKFSEYIVQLNSKR